MFVRLSSTPTLKTNLSKFLNDSSNLLDKKCTKARVAGACEGEPQQNPLKITSFDLNNYMEQHLQFREDPVTYLYSFQVIVEF